MNAIMMRAALLCSVLGLCAGCGDDGASASAARPPTVGLPVVECGAYSGEGNLGEYTGDVLLGLTVQVTDPNGDLSYVDATVGLLRTMEKVKWFGKVDAEPTRMIFAYTPLSKGQTRVQPIFIARKPKSILGRLKSYSLLLAMAFGFLWLRDEDGKVYDNIRFQPNALLKIDQGVARFVQYVNRLKLSSWSTTQQYGDAGRGLIALPSRNESESVPTEEAREDVG